MNVLRDISSTTSKLSFLLQDAKKDVHRIQTLLNTLDDSLNALWPYEEDETPDVTSRQSRKNESKSGELSILNLASDERHFRETTSLLTSSRIISYTAQAEDVISSLSKEVEKKRWFENGVKYARWIGKGVVRLQAQGLGRKTEKVHSPHQNSKHTAPLLLGQSFQLGYNDDIVETVTNGLLSGEDIDSSTHDFCSLMQSLKHYQQRTFLFSLLNYLNRIVTSKKFIGAQKRIKNNETSIDTNLNRKISATAGLLQRLTKESSPLQENLCEYVLAYRSNLSLSRAIIAALPGECRQKVFEKTWTRFSDRICIKHDSLMTQESNTQLLLLLVGYVHRTNPIEVLVTARSTQHGSAISDRIASSSVRVRWLGMVVGTAISQLLDKEGSRLSFDVEDMKNEEAKWWLNLVNVDDKTGPISDLCKQSVPKSTGDKQKEIQKLPIRGAKPNREQKNSTPKIIEVISDEEDDDDLVPYAKPDSDPEDSDEDPTAINRDKPKAPVYIRDLMSGLRNEKDYDAHHIALKTTPSLIRRKADFGNELKDQAEELASILVGLSESSWAEDELPIWHELRQQSLIALVVAQPRVIAPWLAKEYFSGDYSLSQRAAMLSGLGLGARELAGFKDKNSTDQSAMFPSKMLPGRFHNLYLENNPSNKVAKQLEQSMLMTAISTKKRERPRKKILKNDLSSMVAECFFFPLAGYYASSSQVSASKHSTINEPHLLGHYLNTLTIILTSAGSSTLLLPQLTTEYFSLLFSVRGRALSYSPILEATLFGFLSILELNEDTKRLASENSKELIECREWTGMVLERLEGRGVDLGGVKRDFGRLNMEGSDKDGQETGERMRKGAEEERSAALAAGVLTRIAEVVKEWEKLMIGELAGL